MKEPIYIGVDGGGTQCRLRLENVHGDCLGEAVGGPANICLSVDQSWASINAALIDALRAADRRLDDPSCHYHAGFGLAGTESETAKAAFLSHAHPFSTLTLLSDAQSACLGAHGGKDGAILIVGTGSIAYAHVAGKNYRVGGLGFPHSDEGSGAWLGQRALKTELRDRLLGEKKVIPTNSTDFASFAPIVIDMANKKNATALALMDAAAKEIDGLYFSLLDQVGATLPVSLLGGIAQHLMPFLSEAIMKHLVVPHSDAVSGAIMMAKFKSLGVE